jgi:two-component system, chemotaxis family, CheB/CheR fusion protein
MAQAEFDETAMKGMPTNAAATGLVDHVIPVEDMPEKILAHQAEFNAALDWPQASREDWRKHLKKIASLLRTGVGHDFTNYKENTLIRRVRRRMQMLEIDEVEAYIAHLEANPHEADLLFRELLIGVTQFFRDPEAFEALRTMALPAFFADRNAEDPVRVWVAGCATGEDSLLVGDLASGSDERGQCRFQSPDLRH